MTIQLVKTGNYENDGTGDDLHTAFEKMNNNIIALNNVLDKVEFDTSPKLGGNLDLNGKYIDNGDVRGTIHGYDFPLFAGLINLMIFSNQTNIELGSFTQPSDTVMDMGHFKNPPSNIIDFGLFNYNF